MRTLDKPGIIPIGTVMNTTLNSLAMPTDRTINFGIQIVFTGTPTGSFKLQASCDPVAAPSQVYNANGVVTFTPTNWSTVANSTFTVSAAGDVEWDYQNVGFNYVRVVYTDTSGGSSTAVITAATMCGKGI
jgi:hypothetical protein